MTAARNAQIFLRPGLFSRHQPQTFWRFVRPHRRCWTARSDPGERWPYRLVATAEEDSLNPLIDVMPCRKFVSGIDPEHWRFRAEETRTVADQMTHEEARTIMRRIANDYDRLAKVAEEQLADQERGAIGDKT